MSEPGRLRSRFKEMLRQTIIKRRRLLEKESLFKFQKRSKSGLIKLNF